MVVGVDTYSYHRLLGQPRPGETPLFRLSDDLPTVIGQARALRCDVVSLQTCFLDQIRAHDPAWLADLAAPMTPLIAWGHPEGLRMGDASPEVLDDLRRWIEIAAALGTGLVRIVVGGPRLRRADGFAERLRATLPSLRAAADHAATGGLELAIENHGDLTSGELAELIVAAGRDNLGACFDTANAARVGEDVVAAARRLAPLVRMVHAKDTEPPASARSRVGGPRSVAFGSGAIPLGATIEALSEPIAAGAPVCVEIGQLGPGDDELELVADGVAWLRRLEAPHDS